MFLLSRVHILHAISAPSNSEALKSSIFETIGFGAEEVVVVHLSDHNRVMVAQVDYHRSQSSRG